MTTKSGPHDVGPEVVVKKPIMAGHTGEAKPLYLDVLLEVRM